MISNYKYKFIISAYHPKCLFLAKLVTINSTHTITINSEIVMR